jgi:hypothetical protein
LKTTKVSICLDLEEAKVEASHSLIERALHLMPGAERHSLSIEVRAAAGSLPFGRLNHRPNWGTWPA